MCHSILRVKYISEKGAQTVEVDSERALQQKLKELQENSQVTEIQVFPRKHDVILSKEWKVQMYVPATEGET